MTFKQLLDAARIALSDTTGTTDKDFNLSTAAAVLFYNEAIHEACRRARLIVDRSTPAICSYSVTAGVPSVSIDPRIIKIRRASLISRNDPLRRRYVADMDELLPGWETHTGTVDSYVADYATDMISLYRIPAVDDTLKLVVVRLPLIDLTGASNQSPEIKVQYHPALVQYVVYKVRSIEDSELYDVRKASAAYAEFEKEFGVKRSAQDEMWDNSQDIPEYE